MNVTEALVESAALAWYADLGYQHFAGPEKALEEPVVKYDSLRDLNLNRLHHSLWPLIPCRVPTHSLPSSTGTLLLPKMPGGDLNEAGVSPTAQVEASRYLKKWSGPSGFLVAEGNGAQRRYRLKNTS